MHLRSIVASLVSLPLLACSSGKLDDPNASQFAPMPSPEGATMSPGGEGSTDGSAAPPELPPGGEAPVNEDTPLTDGMEMPIVGSPPAETPPVEEPPVTEEECTREFTMPTFEQLQANTRLPDPFTFLDGTKVVTRGDWACRRKEISLLAQEFIYGRKPGAPEALAATFANGTLSISVTNNGQTSQFSVVVQLPQGATEPVPGILSLGGLTPAGVAVLNVRNALNQLAESTGSQGRQSPPQGDFYRLWPDYQSTGSLMAWAWTASRIIDALEQTTGHNVDTTRLSALGCSRDGKTAGTMALFDDRFALVAAQSPGSGMTSGWRVAETQGNVQKAGQIYGEDTWMGGVFQPFGGQNVTRLPVDQHEVLALAWPRPLIMMEGTNDSWNCPVCSYTTMKYTQEVYTALGTADKIAFPQPDHGHCAQAGTFAETYYDSFVDRFLNDNESVSTAGLFTDGNFTFDADRWQDGTIPTLE